MGALSSSTTQLLSTAVFRSGAKDVLPTQDVYTTKGVSSVINTTQGRFSPVSTDFLSSLTSIGTGILTGLASSLSLSALGSGKIPSINSTAVLSRMEGAMGTPLSRLSSGLQSSLAQAVGLRANDFNLITLTVAGIATRLTTSDPQTVTGVSGLINQVSNNSRLATVTDVGSTAATVSALTSQLITMGAPQAVTAVFATITDPDVQKAALLDNVQAAISKSDLSTLQLIIDSQGVGGVLSKVPNAGLQLIKSYRFPTGSTATQYAALGVALANILTQLDPAWATATRGTNTWGSLSYFGVASANALTVLATDNAYALPALLGNTYKSRDAITALKQLYPFMLTQ